MPDGFIANTIFLLRERQSDKGRGKEVRVRAGGVGEGARANPELDVAQAEKGWPGKAEVLARAEQEKEAENEALRRRPRKWGGFGVGCGPDLGDNAKRKGFDP